MGIKPKIINKIIYTTLLLACVCLLIGTISHHVQEGMALFTGALWGSVNLFFLKLLVQNLLIKRSANLQLFAFMAIKWPLLYLAGYGLLKMDYFPSYYLLAGLSTLFLMIFILIVAEAIKGHAK